jgi:hypothetical protein
MRSPIVAMLWENWRLTRVEAASRLALGIVAGSTALTFLDSGATVAFAILMFVNSFIWLSIAKLNGGRFADGYKPGFPLYLLYTRPVPTAVLVGVAMAYDAISCTALYLVSAALLGLAFDRQFPLFSVAICLMAFHLCYACVQWSTQHRVLQWGGSLVFLAPFLLFRDRVTPSLQGEFTLAENAVMALIGVVAFGLTVTGVARQRRGGAVAIAARTVGSGGYPNWLISLFRFPCPTSSATKAQVWFELKSSGLPVLAIGLVLAILTFLMFVISIPVTFLRPVAAGFAVLSVPVVLSLGGNAFGIRRKQGRTYASTFEVTQPYGTAQMASIKMLVRSGCVLAALIAVGVSVWTSTSLVSSWGSWVIQGNAIEGAPGLTLPRQTIGQAIGSLTGYAHVALAFVTCIGAAIMVALLAAFAALWARYSRRMIIAGSLLLFCGFSLVLLALAAQRGIGPVSLLDTIASAASWIAPAALVFATVYLFWNAIVERVLTDRYACGALVISAVFGAAWLTMLHGAGVQFAGMPATNAVSMLWQLLLPLMAGALAPWSLNRIRHI